MHISNGWLHYLVKYISQETTVNLKQISHLTTNFNNLLKLMSWTIFVTMNIQMSSCGSNAVCATNQRHR